MGSQPVMGGPNCSGERCGAPDAPPVDGMVACGDDWTDGGRGCTRDCAGGVLPAMLGGVWGRLQRLGQRGCDLRRRCVPSHLHRNVDSEPDLQRRV